MSKLVLENKNKNQPKADDSISREDCIAAIRLIQEAATADREAAI